VVLGLDPDSDPGDTVEEIRDILTENFPEITKEVDEDVSYKSQQIIELLNKGGHSVFENVMDHFNR
jgi:hypothetical protein